MRLNNIRIIKDLFSYICCAVFVTVTLYVFFDNIPRTIEAFCIIIISAYFIILFFMTTYIFICDKERWVVTEIHGSIQNDDVGVAKIDRFGIMQRVEQDSQKGIEENIAVHEAGHTVMAYLLGFEMYGLEINSHEIARLVTYSEMNTKEDVRNMILLKYAGAVAEELLIGSFGYGNMGFESSDFETAKSLIKAYIVMTDKDVSKSLMDVELADKIIVLSKEFYAQTYEILSNETDKIKRLSELIKGKVSVSLSIEEINKILESTED